MISSILRKLATFLSFFYKNKVSHTLKDSEILKEINFKLDLSKPLKSNLKKTHKEFNSQIYNLIKTKRINNFLRENFIQKMFFVHNRIFIYDELKKLKNEKKWFFYKKLLVEDDTGNPVRYFLYPKSSGNKINHVFHLSLLINAFNLNLTKIPKVFEFGGGYGCMARIFSKINPKIKYTSFDTYYVSLLQYYFLKRNNLNVGFKKHNNFSLQSTINSIKYYNKNNSNYIFIANWSISETPIKFRKKFETIISGSKYILIGFQEKFEDINNLNYFNSLKKKLSNKFKIKIIKNEFYKGNLLKKQNHFYFLAKKK
jgi:hypothetical protein